MDILDGGARSNREMWEHCELLKKILEVKVPQVVGRGKSVQTIMVPKYKKDATYERIKASCEHYKKLYMDELKGGVEFRPYQLDIIKEGTARVRKDGFVYLAMEVRTGKTLTALGIAANLKPSKVLFVTKKKAIKSIEFDYNLLKPDYFLKVINYESLHTVTDMFNWDVVVLDEAHSLGAFPKPSIRADLVKQLVKKYNPKVILLSGTPTPESYSQMYHQVFAIPGSPFHKYKNFYRFCDDHVTVKERMINSLRVKDYSNGKTSILMAMAPHTISYTQKEAGFEGVVNEHFVYIPMPDQIKSLINKLTKARVIVGKGEIILADTAVKLMSKIHQLTSGTIKFESGNSMVIDTSKAEFIKEHFAGKKLGIFYKFKEEFNALKTVFGDSLTDRLDEFDATDKSIALQIVSGREGISLKRADLLVFYNIDFSATSYWQARDRMTTQDRQVNDVYWVFTSGGIEEDIYDAVSNKIDYTVNHFKKKYNDF
jgi:hypothetical protein